MIVGLATGLGADLWTTGFFATGFLAGAFFFDENPVSG
jgi:hypothetical protein